jgi:hypothetical protein
MYDQRDGTVFAVGAGPEGVAQPMPQNVQKKLEATGRHARVMEIGSGMTEAAALEKKRRWERLPHPVLISELARHTGPSPSCVGWG